MAEPFLAEIIMFGGNFAPRGWALCNGQLLQISSNTALFSILGTTFGGDGRTTFALPDMRGRIPIHDGTGPGLSPYRLGQRGGTETIPLNANQLPAHTHAVQCANKGGNERSPVGAYPAVDGTGVAANFSDRPANATSKWPETTNAGSGQAHNNVQPFQCVNFIIALQGIFPSRN